MNHSISLSLLRQCLTRQCLTRRCLLWQRDRDVPEELFLLTSDLPLRRQVQNLEEVPDPFILVPPFEEAEEADHTVPGEEILDLREQGMEPLPEVRSPQLEVIEEILLVLSYDAMCMAFSSLK